MCLFIDERTRLSSSAKAGMLLVSDVVYIREHGSICNEKSYSACCKYKVVSSIAIQAVEETTCRREIGRPN